jgi:FkbM family methyltransferase
VTSSAVSIAKRARASRRLNPPAVRTAKRIATVFHLDLPLFQRLFAPVGCVVTELPGGRVMKIETRADDQVARYVYWKGWHGYQPELTPLFFDFALEASCVVDVGAYIGFYSLLAASANSDAQVYAFEPSSLIFPRLERNIALNDVPRVDCQRVACGVSAGVVELIQPVGGCPSSSSLSQDFFASHDDLEEATISRYAVPVVTLDDFLRGAGVTSLDLVKIDTEGTEPDVLRGCIETIERDQPAIFCEMLPTVGTAETIVGLLRPLGYSFFALTENGPCHQEYPRPRGAAVDYLFTMLDSEQVDMRWRRARERAEQTSAARLDKASRSGYLTADTR